MTDLICHFMSMSYSPYIPSSRSSSASEDANASRYCQQCRIQCHRNQSDFDAPKISATLKVKCRFLEWNHTALQFSKAFICREHCLWVCIAYSKIQPVTQSTNTGLGARICHWQHCFAGPMRTPHPHRNPRKPIPIPILLDGVKGGKGRGSKDMACVRSPKTI